MKRSRFRQATAVAIALTAAFGGALATSSANPPPASATAWPAWIARPAATSCDPGSTPIVATSASVDALGVARVRYAAMPTLTTVIPPRGFVAAHASAPMLRDLGAGASASSGATSASRASGLTAPMAGMMEQLARNPSAPSFCRSVTPRFLPSIPAPAPAASGTADASDDPSDDPADDGISFNHEYSGNWAGYVVDGTWDGAYGAWTVETSGPIGQANMEGTWVGIGGDQNDVDQHPGNWSLLQAGTQMQTGHGYQSWFEYVSSAGSINPQYGSALGVQFSTANGLRPGDDVSALVYWQSSSEACFLFTDSSRSTGSFNGCIQNLAIPFDRNSMEWIDEKVSGWTLSDFGQTNWTSQSAYNASDGSFRNFAAYGNTASILTNAGVNGPTPPCGSSPSLLAYPENVSSANGGSSDTVRC